MLNMQTKPRILCDFFGFYVLDDATALLEIFSHTNELTLRRLVKTAGLSYTCYN